MSLPSGSTSLPTSRSTIWTLTPPFRSSTLTIWSSPTFTSSHRDHDEKSSQLDHSSVANLSVSLIRPSSRKCNEQCNNDRAQHRQPGPRSRERYNLRDQRIECGSKPRDSSCLAAVS